MKLVMIKKKKEWWNIYRLNINLRAIKKTHGRFEVKKKKKAHGLKQRKFEKAPQDPHQLNVQ